MKRIKVGIVGAGGYGGSGAAELLIGHPQAELVALIDLQDVGKPLSDLYPHLKGFCDLPIQSPDSPDLSEALDVVLFATPDGVGQKKARFWLENGVKVIDYSGDFRFSHLDQYREYAARIGRSQEHASPDLLGQAAYGIAELHRDQISKSNLVGNPGCFAVSCILGLAPAIHDRIIETDSIICDSKTGVSGAGKKPAPSFHYPSRYEAINAYRISGHQHVYEIERELGLILGDKVKMTFTPHVLPMARGILSTLYGTLAAGQNLNRVLESYRTFYENEPFVRVFGPEVPHSSTDVRGSNFCNLSLNVDKRTGKLIVISLIDNLVKGQAGSAVQNMNIMFGVEETAGLFRPGLFP